MFTLLLLSVSAQLAAEQFELTGPLTQGALVIGNLREVPQKDFSVFLNEQQVDVTPEGTFVIGFGRDAPLEQILELKIGAELVANKLLKLRQRSYQTQRVEGVPQETVTPRLEKLARIRAESALVSAARQHRYELAYFQRRFIAPMNAPVTGVYGSQRIYNGVPKRPHFGVDYAAPVGTLVYAPASGVVTLTHDDMYYSGGTLIIDHGYGVSSTFLHLSELLVKEGDSIRRGDPVAKVGKGGRASGPHLDWRMNWYTVRIDPQLVLELDLPE